jgi:hypothetical protein
MLMREAIKWHKNSINPCCVACILFLGRFCKLCVFLYGIPIGVEQDVARHDVHLCSTNRLQDLCLEAKGYTRSGNMCLWFATQA